jgi:hypothetical protein
MTAAFENSAWMSQMPMGWLMKIEGFEGFTIDKQQLNDDRWD